MSGEVNIVKFKIMRFNPEKDQKPYFKEYEVPVSKGMTILDALNYIQENLDATVSYRWSCRMGICGSCGMIVNGIPMLACQTQILQLNSRLIELKPLTNFPIIKDLATDFTPLFEKHRSIRPFIERKDIKEQMKPTREYLQTPEELLQYLQFAYCIKCGLCNAACPTMATDPDFLGPQALSQTYRYIADSRNENLKDKIESIDNSHGLWRCHFAGTCSLVCPRGLDPALAIQLLKRTVLSYKLGFRRPRKAAQVAQPWKRAKREGIPAPPPHTV